MSSAERISFLQEKLQEIRKYYMSLKSEVASIDRRRKRLKKKEREGKFAYNNNLYLLIIIYNIIIIINDIKNVIVFLFILFRSKEFGNCT